MHKQANSPPLVLCTEFYINVLKLCFHFISGMAQLFDDDFLLCGASLICTNWVITAAHCFLDPSENTLNLEATRYRVMLGRNFRKFNIDERGSQSYIPSRIFSHPDYTPAMNLHDIALIGLPKAVRISDYVRPICLPTLSKQLGDDISKVADLGMGNDVETDGSAASDGKGENNEAGENSDITLKKSRKNFNNGDFGKILDKNQGKNDSEHTKLRKKLPKTGIYWQKLAARKKRRTARRKLQKIMTTRKYFDDQNSNANSEFPGKIFGQKKSSSMMNSLLSQIDDILLDKRDSKTSENPRTDYTFVKSLEEYISSFSAPGSEHGKYCWVAGWGGTESGDSIELKQAPLKIREIDECQRLYMYYFPEAQMCAGGHHERDTCQGDSGGPLMCTSEEHHNFGFQKSDRVQEYWVMHGITSFGTDCGEKGRPGGYTRVSHYLEWIEGIIGEKCGKTYRDHEGDR